MARYVVLGVGTLLAVQFIIQLLRGAKYDQMVKDLDGRTFPLHFLYGAGLVWSSGKLYRLKPKRSEILQQQAGMLYPPRFAEYYANISWAGAVTLGHLFAAVSLLAAGIIFSFAPVVIAMGAFMGAYMIYFLLTNMKDRIDERRNACENQLADVVSSLAVLLNAGMVMRETWKLVSESGEGALYELMRTTTNNMNSGMSEREAYQEFSRLSDSTDIRKFTSAMLQSMEKGGGELTAFLIAQSSELWEYKRQRMLQEGEKAATKLLMPIMLIFVGIMIIILAAAFAGSVFG